MKYRLNDWTIESELQPVDIRHKGHTYAAEGARVEGKGKRLWIISYEPRLWNERRGLPFGPTRLFIVADESGRVLVKDRDADVALANVH